ncbi:tetraacyldisaccharide 4'-kinase [Pasteurellaceae bacterium RH1A]|nr:tetraacyldisaccharide 4'-kinase [Pasteurellaceae bacterium RH1A]
MKLWQERTLLTWLLSPLSLLFWIISSLRRWLYRAQILKSYRSPVPVLVVGNISVGGNGKTPVVVWLVEQLQARGIKVGVISRGYGGQTKAFPQLVTKESSAQMVGDEPVLIVQRTGVPLAISPNRRESIELLLSQFELDLIITDDGLQHYALERDIEWAVVDSNRLFGNGFLLPAGGLRELPSRLKSVQAVIFNGKVANPDAISMQLQGDRLINVKTGECKKIADFDRLPWVAMAGIGDPNRFLKSLKTHLSVGEGNHFYPFADHQAYTLERLQPLTPNHEALLMTEKDAVKCRAFAQDNWWYMPVDAVFEVNQAELLLGLVLDLVKHK